MDKYKVTVNNKSYSVEIEKSDAEKFDYSSYEKSLEKILEQTQKEYWIHYVDINRHQVVVGRNNLWVAAALIGALSTLYSLYYQKVDLISVTGVVFIISYISVILAFGICLYAMPARKGYKSVYQNNWVDFSLSAHRRLEKKEANAYCNFLSDLITKTDAANIINIKTNTARGKLFRITSWLLISSFVFALICIGLFIISETQNSICSVLTSNIENHMRCICEQRGT
ncbi:hypothetical protein [Methylobacter sp. BBA5.1]|uniref:hypothetical protein n=1 Tax=Methylobacter sp. BBA5.1 TaxID=1495064 RepID=UPI00056C93B1|nr:hypothetical protein [Methylobacter sp. BBA5.1]